MKKEPNLKSPKKPIKPKPSLEKFIPQKPNPTRYGDWEKNGRCIDF